MIFTLNCLYIQPLKQVFKLCVWIVCFSLWLCTFSLAVSVGSALLLPISILSNEILLYYPNSYYVKWLNSSLIQGTVTLWDSTIAYY
jgi:hypothetical protein